MQEEPNYFVLISGVVLGIMAYIFRNAIDRCRDALTAHSQERKVKRALELTDAIKTIRRSVIGHRALTEDETKALEFVLEEAEYRTPHLPTIRNGYEVCPECNSSLNFAKGKVYCNKCGKRFRPYGEGRTAD